VANAADGAAIGDGAQGHDLYRLMSPRADISIICDTLVTLPTAFIHSPMTRRLARMTWRPAGEIPDGQPELFILIEPMSRNRVYKLRISSRRSPVLRRTKLDHYFVARLRDEPSMSNFGFAEIAGVQGSRLVS